MNEPSISTIQDPRTSILTLVVINPTNEPVPFTYKVDENDEKVIQVIPNASGESQKAEFTWDFKTYHKVKYGIFMENHPEWSIPWQEVEIFPVAQNENVYPSVKIGE